MKFGEFVKLKRMEKGINLRKMADLMNIAPAYLSDIEKGKRNSPSADKMEKIGELLNLSDEDKITMYDLAAEARENTVAPDISNYVVNNYYIRVALRKAKMLNLGEKEWMKIIESMEQKIKED